VCDLTVSGILATATERPAGLSVDAIEDVFLLLNDEYVPA
jgi:hypothetical protein